MRNEPTQMIEWYKEIAKLHRAELSTTEAHSHWRAGFWSLVSLNDDLQTPGPLEQKTEALERHLSGLKSILPELVSPEHLERAKELVGQICNALDELKLDLLRSKNASVS